MYRAFTHSFMKVTSRHSFTLFGPFLWKKPLFWGENGVWKCLKSVQIKENLLSRQNWPRNGRFSELFHFALSLKKKHYSGTWLQWQDFWLLCNNNFQKRLIKKISAEFALFTLSFIRNFQNKNHFMGVLHNLLRGFNSAGSNKQENNTLRQKP